MKIYIITSDHNKIPLAEIRTDGNKIDWVIDNTNGRMPQVAQGSFQALTAFIGRSSHLKISPPSTATIGLLRYSMENGDIVEITTDGKSAMLNGAILEEEEKNALINLISSGKIKVKNKADLSMPLPIVSNFKPAKKAENKINSDRLNQMDKASAKIKEKNSVYNKSYDKTIEDVDFSESHCPEMGRQLLYLLKYGE